MFVIWLLKVTAKIERHTAKHQVYKHSSNCLFSFEIRILVKNENLPYAALCQSAARTANTLSSAYKTITSRS